MTASSSSLSRQLMLTGLFLESVQYGMFLLSFCIVIFFLVSKARCRGAETAPRRTYHFFLFATVLVATAHAAIAFSCSLHSDVPSPSDWFFTAQTALFVTQIILTLGLLLHRIFVIYDGRRLFMFPVPLIFLVGSVVAGVATAYATTQSDLELRLSLHIASSAEEASFRRTFAHFSTWMTAFLTCALISSLSANVLLIHRLFSARRAKRFRLGQAMLRARMLTSLLLDSGLPGSLVLATILLVHTVAGTAASLVIENFAVPLIGLSINLTILLGTLGLSFGGSPQTDLSFESADTVTIEHTFASPRAGRAPLPHPGRSQTPTLIHAKSPSSASSSSYVSGASAISEKSVLPNPWDAPAPLPARAPPTSRVRAGGPTVPARAFRSKAAGWARRSVDGVRGAGRSKLRQVVNAEDVQRPLGERRDAEASWLPRMD